MTPRIIAFVVIAAILGVAGCKRQSSPPAPDKQADTLVLCVGGLGSDRTVTLATALRARCPRAIVVSVGNGWDAYKVDIRPIIASYPTPHKVYLFHSFAAWWLTQPLPDADYVAAIEPVNPGGSAGSWWGDLPYPTYARRLDVYWRTSAIGPRVARIPGTTPIYIPGGHSDVPESPDLIDRTVRIVNREAL